MFLLSLPPNANSRLPDPELETSLNHIYRALDVDLLTWKSIVSTALFTLYGLVGQARHFDVLVKQKTMPALKCIIRVQPEDAEVFATSLSSHSFGLGDYFGSELELSGRVRVVSLLPYLGMVTPLE